MLRLAALTWALFGQEEEPPTFGRDQRVAAAYYLPAPDAADRAEFLEMGRCGIGLAVILGTPSAVNVVRLASALDGPAAEGREVPRLCPSVADPAAAVAFFRALPRRHWGCVEGRPVVWLAPRPAGSPDPAAALREVRESLGRDAYVVAEASWSGVRADRTYCWGASHQGPRDRTVVAVGPGAVDPPRDREDGKFYERSWFAALRLQPRMVVVETWNDPGTGVRESVAWKRKYLDVTALMVRHFKVGEKVAPPKGKLTGLPQVQYTLKFTPREQGLRPVSTAEGLFHEIQLRGTAMLSTRENKAGDRRTLAFDVDDTFCFFDKRSFEVMVEFLDTGEGAWTLEYDSADPTLGPEARTVKATEGGRFTGTGEWRVATIPVPDALFGNSQPGGTDLRLVTEKRGLAVRRVIVAAK